MERDRTLEGVALLLTGLAAGATLALLLAPMSGNRMRRQIRRKAEDVRDDLQQIGEDLIERGRELIEHGKAIASEKAEALGKRIRAVTV